MDCTSCVIFGIVCVVSFCCNEGESEVLIAIKVLLKDILQIIIDNSGWIGDSLLRWQQ